SGESSETKSVMLGALTIAPLCGAIVGIGLACLIESAHVSAALPPLTILTVTLPAWVKSLMLVPLIYGGISWMLTREGSLLSPSELIGPVVDDLASWVVSVAPREDMPEGVRREELHN